MPKSARHLLTWLSLFALAGLPGCGQEPKDAEPVLDIPAQVKPAPNPIGDGKPLITQATARLHQPFKEAVLLDPPEDENRPPDKTFAGKDVARLFEQIAGKDSVGGLWDKAEFVDAKDKLLRTTAQIKTDFGTIEIELFPEAAPNHVRNFVALARAGYYDGLPFHRSVRRQIDEHLHTYLEAGCPLGTGEAGYGSIGYWLKPEISPSLIHEDGTVGAFRDDESEASACKFYITLGKAAWRDGNHTIFGKITRGFDVAHTINSRPVNDEFVPREPILIRSVTIIQE